MLGTALALGVFWILWGVLGFAGFLKRVPAKYEGQSWTKTYVRRRGAVWLVLGLLWLGYYLVRTLLLPDANLSAGTEALILIILGVPSVIGAIVLEKKCDALLSHEPDDTPDS